MPSPTFPPEEMIFLRALLDMPEDRNTWLVYADWLDDRSDPRAEFLRLSVAHSLMAADDSARPAAEARLKQLRAELDPNWMMMFDPAWVQNCYACAWAGMAPTDLLDIRLCRECGQSVVYCHTAEEAEVFASCGQRIALSTRVTGELNVEEVAAEAPADLDTELNPDSLEFLDAVPPTPPPEPGRQRPWWKFW